MATAFPRAFSGRRVIGESATAPAPDLDRIAAGPDLAACRFTRPPPARGVAVPAGMSAAPVARVANV